MSPQLAAEKGNALDTRMLSCLLSGMHRAVPFCDAPGEMLVSQLASLYRCAHSVNFSTGVQAIAATDRMP